MAEVIKEFENTTELLDFLLKGKKSAIVAGPGDSVLFDVIPVDIWERMEEGEIENLFLLDRKGGKKIREIMSEEELKKDEDTAGSGGLSDYRESLREFFRKHGGFKKDEKEARIKELDGRTLYLWQDLARLKTKAEKDSLFIDHGTMDFVVETESFAFMKKLKELKKQGLSDEEFDRRLKETVKEHLGEKKGVFDKIRRVLAKRISREDFRKEMFEKIMRNYLDKIDHGCVFLGSDEMGEIDTLKDVCKKMGVETREYKLKEDEIEFPGGRGKHQRGEYQLPRVLEWKKK